MIECDFRGYKFLGVYREQDDDVEIASRIERDLNRESKQWGRAR